MAHPLDSLPERRQGRPPKYPWADWTDGRAWRIEQGRDYEVPSLSMAANLRSHAFRSGLTVRVVSEDGGRALSFQFSEPVEPSEAAA